MKKFTLIIGYLSLAVLSQLLSAHEGCTLYEQYTKHSDGRSSYGEKSLHIHPNPENDHISSTNMAIQAVKVANGCTLMVWPETEYKGDIHVFVKDSEFVGQVSSAHCECRNIKKH